VKNQTTNTTPTAAGALGRQAEHVLHGLTIGANADATADACGETSSETVVTADSRLRAPSRRTRGDRGKACNIAVGDCTLCLRKRIRERLTMGEEVLLQSGMDDISRAAALDFGDQPQRSMIVLVYAKRLGSQSSHVRYIVT
jgi:hypothetical protein